MLNISIRPTKYSSEDLEQALLSASVDINPTIYTRYRMDAITRSCMREPNYYPATSPYKEKTASEHRNNHFPPLSTHQVQLV